MLLGVILLAVGLVCLVPGLRSLRETLWLRRNGVRTSGRVSESDRPVRIEDRTGAVTSEGAGAAQFEFTTEDGSSVWTAHRLRVDPLPSGREVTVAYDPDDPRRAHVVEAWTQLAGGAVLTAVGCVFTLIGIMIAVVILSTPSPA